jgi:tight adherence protein B
LPFLIAVLAGVLAALILWQMILFATRRQRHLAGRMRVAVGQASSDAPNAALPAGTIVKKRRRWFSVIPAMKGVFGQKYVERARVNLAKAGVPLRPEELASICLVTSLILAGLGIAARKGLPLATLLGVVGLVFPHMWVSLLKRRRAAKLESQLLDALALLANSLRAGHSFMQALELVGRDMGPPLGPEIARVLRESRIGLSIDEAFEALTERFDSRDLELVVTGVLIQRQVGGNLAEVFDNIASTIDNRIKSRAKVRALTAQGRMTAWVISLLPFALAAVIFGMYPDFSAIMLSTPAGLGMLSGAGLLLLIGVFLLRKVVNVDA